MIDLRPGSGIQLTREQADKLSRTADSLRNGEQEAAKKSWSLLIQSLGMSRRGITEGDVDGLIWRAIYESRLAADITEATSAEALKDEITEMEKKLEAFGEEGQRANIDLQNEIQKQQQLIQMISNACKVLHDTALAIIRNLR